MRYSKNVRELSSLIFLVIVSVYLKRSLLLYGKKYHYEFSQLSKMAQLLAGGINQNSIQHFSRKIQNFDEKYLKNLLHLK